MNITYQKPEPKIIHYRSFKCFCYNKVSELLHEVISLNLEIGCDKTYEHFLVSCNKILDSHTTQKKNKVRNNHSFF